MSKVDEMVAGRELDALVAEKVMGWTKVREWGNGYVDVADGWGGIPADGKYIVDLPPYSTDIAAAMTVLDAVVNRLEGTTIVRMEAMFPGSGDAPAFDCEFGSPWDGPEIGAGGDSLPEAICRAAPKAVSA